MNISHQYPITYRHTISCSVKIPLLTVFAGPVREPLLRPVWRGAPSQQGIQAPQLGYKRLRITFEMI